MSQRLYDPGLFFEEDGTAYVLHGQGQLFISRLKLVNEESGEYQVDESFVEADENGYHDKTFYNYQGGHFNEGSHVIKVNDVYYALTTPTWKGTDTKKEICIQTKDLVNGPYEVKDIHSSFMNFGENGVHQGGIVDVPCNDGSTEWWSIIFQGRHKLGRTPTLQPVFWETDENGLRWPMIGAEGRNGDQAVVTERKPKIEVNVPTEYAAGKVQYYDDFSSDRLNLCWQWNHVPDDSGWSLTECPGCLRLHTVTVTDDFAAAQNTLRQRVIGPESQAEIKLNVSHMLPGDQAGLAIHQKEYTYIAVKSNKESGEKQVILNDNGSIRTAVDIPKGTETIWFRAKSIKMEYRAEYFYSLDGEHYTRLGGRYDMHYGYYVGMGYGIFNFAEKETGGYVDLEYFYIDAGRENQNGAALGARVEAEHYDLQKYEVIPGEEPSRKNNLLTTWTADYVYTGLLTKWGDAYDLAVDNLHDGDWMRYNQIELGEGADWFNARVSGCAEGGVFEVRQGAPDGKLLAVLEVPNTGDRETFQNVFARMDHSVTGKQTLTLVYHGGKSVSH